MNNSATTSIVCAALAGVILLVIVVIQIRRNNLRRRSSPAAETATPPELAAIEVLQPMPAPQAQPVEAVVVQAPEPDEPLAIPPMTSLEIVTHLKTLPAVQAEVEKEKYKGVKVEWTLYFSSQMLKPNNQVEVTLLNANNDYPGVSFLIDMNQYAEMRGIKWGRPVTVQGEISSVYSMYIILTNVELSFPDLPNP